MLCLLILILAAAILIAGYIAKQSRYVLYKRLRTKDGHYAEIHRNRNALLVFRYQYHVTILSKAKFRTLRRDKIYGWSGVYVDEVIKQVRDWDASIIFERNAYLLDIADKYRVSAGTP